MRWISSLSQRLLLFVIASLVAVLLLHVPAGIHSPEADAPAAFSAAKWLGESGEYLSQLARGDLGVLRPLRVSGYMQEKQMADELADRAPASLTLLLLALGLSLSAGTLLGLLSSRFGLRWLRSPTLLGTMLLLSTPDILVVMGLRMLVVWGLSAFGIKLFSLSSFGTALQPSHFIAPTLALAALPTALVARVAVVAFDHVYDQLYMRTALSKGVSPVRAVFRHALKNAWIRVAEAGPLLMASLVTGLVVVEYILYFPGVGRTLGLILEKGGQPGASTSIGLVLLLFAFLIDMGFALVRMALDPRLKEQEEGRGYLAGGGIFRSLTKLPSALARTLRALPTALASAFRALMNLPAALAGALRALPAALGEGLTEAAWAWRPSRVLREIFRNPVLLAGLIGVGALAVVALFGSHFLDLSKADQIPRYIIAGEQVFFPPYKPGTPGYPLGSDMAGRDLLTRLVIGARYTFFFTLAVTPVRLLIALPWGLTAGLRGGLWRAAGRTLGLVFSALPVLLIPAALLPLVPVLGDQGGISEFWLITVILAAAGIPRLVEQIRQHAESVAVQPFVEGAEAVGASQGRIFWRHIFPHLLPQLWVIAAADMAWTLLLLAQFGVFSIYLGGTITVMTGYEIMGNSSAIQMSRISDWSSMLSRPYEVLFQAPWSLWLPALCFLLAIVAFNLLAEGLRRRSQALQSAPLMAETPHPRRRLLAEWMAAAVVVTLLVGVTARFGANSPTPVFGQEAGTSLDRARIQVTEILELASSPAPEMERSQAVGALRKAIPAYVREMRKAGLPLAEMERATGGRLRVLESGDYQIINAYIPDNPAGKPSYVFILDRETGRLISQVATLERAQSFTVLSNVEVLGGQEMDYLILAGTVPTQGDRWGLSVWFGSSENSWYWHNELRSASTLHRKAGGAYGIDQVIELSGAWVVMRQPDETIQVEPNGDVTICGAGGQSCGRYPWLGKGWSN